MARFVFEELVEALMTNHDMHRSSAHTVYGVLSDIPIHLAELEEGNGAKFVAVIVGTDSPNVAEELKRLWLEQSDHLKPKQVDIEPEAVVAKIPVRTAGRLGVDQLEATVLDMVAAARSAGAAKRPRAGARAALVNGVPMYLTEAEAEELSWAGAREAEEYEAMRPRISAGVAMGLVGVAISALVWALVAVFMDLTSWVVAIGAGLLIGYLVLRGVGKTNRGVQWLIGGLTVAAVLLGELASVVLFVAREFGIFDPAASIEIYGEVINQDPLHLLFALGGGLIGAWYGSRLGRKPQIGPQIDLASA